MSPAVTPAGSVQLIVVGRPESPAFFQYVCQCGMCSSLRPSHTILPGVAPSGACATSSARTWSVCTTLPAAEATSGSAVSNTVARPFQVFVIGNVTLTEGGNSRHRLGQQILAFLH